MVLHPKMVRFWDMETHRLVDAAGPEATPVRAIAFHSSGSQLFTALQDGMRVWSWEPSVQHDYVDVPWYKVRCRDVVQGACVYPIQGVYMSYVMHACVRASCINRNICCCYACLCACVMHKP